MPLVSVIIPNYNHARFLERRIRSVLEQTYADFEVVFIDDASTDDSRQAFAAFATHPKLRAVFNQVNSGNPFRQWNQGVGLARGELIWMAEADDYADGRFLERTVPILQAHPRVGLCYCQSQYVDHTGRVLGPVEEGRKELHPSRWTADFINDGRDECARYLVRANTIPNASAVLFRKSVFQSIGCAPERMNLGGDWMTWAKMLLQSDVAYVAAPLNFFRQHARSVSSHRANSQTELQESFQVILQILAQVNVAEAVRSQIVTTYRQRWLDILIANPTARSWAQNRQSRRLARAIDPALARWVAYQYARYCLMHRKWLTPFWKALQFSKRALRSSP